MHSQKIEIPFCPEVRPTAKQFENFYQYVQKLQATYKQQTGIVKVIPPKSWKAHDESYELIKKQMNVHKPIEQQAKMIKDGYYEIRNIIQDSIKLLKFQKKIGNKSAVSYTEPQKIEEQFWKTIKYTPPIYGADLHKSLMSLSAKSWNLGNLDSLLREAVPVLIKGITYPYCYVGTWKSIFCWHKEDLDLSAINYLHEGEKKYWYAIQPEHESILESDAKNVFAESNLNCKHFLRHKTTLINPYKLKQKYPNLKINKAYQGPNEFIVAFSGSYHCGFNSGNNIAEAVNFATKSWLKRLEGVTFCQCVEQSVKPNYKYFLDNLQKSKFKNDPSVNHLKNWVISQGIHNGTIEGQCSEEVENKEEEMNNKISEIQENSKKVKAQKTGENERNKNKMIRKTTKKRVQAKSRNLQ